MEEVKEEKKRSKDSLILNGSQGKPPLAESGCQTTKVDSTCRSIRGKEQYSIVAKAADPLSNLQLITCITGTIPGSTFLLPDLLLPALHIRFGISTYLLPRY